MNSTRQKILDQSKELFNSNGTQATTLRQVALELGISQGNLNYHFKLKQDILEALYFELVQKINIQMASLTQQFSELFALYQSSEMSMRIFYEYRFLIRDLYLIFRESDKIKSHYIELQELRKQQFRGLFNLMIDKKVIRKEEFLNEYDRLYERMNILGDNWINTFELFKLNQADPVHYYQSLLFETIYPYLTDSGKKQYKVLYS